jgi:uncharacterized coiled-coil protein SlyX
MADFSKYYRAYMYMQDLLKNDFTYNYINENLKDGDKGEDTLDGKTSEKVIDMDWVVAIEEALPYIQKAIDEQRRFIKQVDNVVRIELAKQVGPDSVKHLSQHTNFIAKVENGMVTPNKILVAEREESFAIYENRVLMTLIRKALHFVDDKYSKMKDVPNDSYNNLTMVRHLELNDKKLDFKLNYVNENHEQTAEDLDVIDVEELSDFDRIRRIRTTLNEFLSTQLMKEIAKEPEVRPPITQTNMLKKDPNFKKAMELWTFLDSYKREGYEIVGKDFQGKMDEQVQQDVYFTMGFEHFMMSIATNPGLRKLLQQKYEDENARIAEEEARPQKAKEAVLKAQIDAVRKEEMEIRLKEIREREKKILDLTNEVRNLKVTLEQKEQQILTLKGRISVLEDEITALKQELKETKLKLLEAENEIKRLKEENQQLKDKIAELEAHIEELNATIEELNKKIQILNDRVQVLMQENARLESKVKEQEEIIAQQTARIKELEIQTAEQLAKIAALTENLVKCEAQIAEDEKQITDLTDRNEKLVSTLQTEREQTREREAQMNADFEAKTKAADEKHKAEVKEIQQRLDNAEVAHTEYVAKLNADFAEQSNKAEQKRIADLQDQQKGFETQVEKIKQANTDAAAAVNAKHAAEIKKVQKSVDKRVEAAEKAAEKRMQAKVAEIKKDAQDDIKKAEKRASEKAAAARDEARAVKGSVDLFSRDYAFGSVAMVADYAQRLAANGEDNLSAKISGYSKQIKALAVSRSKKDIILSLYSPSGIKLIKKYKKAPDLSVAISDISEQLGSLNDSKVCVTFSGVDKVIAEHYANAVKGTTGDISILHNKSLKSNGFIAVYFCKE